MNKMLIALTVGSTVLIALPVAAQPSETGSYFTESERAPREAVEVTLGAGYTQGFGQMTKGEANNLNDVANGGIAADLGVAYRLGPKLSLGIAGQYQEFSTAYANDSRSRARGLLGGIDATYHIDPYKRFDPWLRVGTGYRMLWTVPTRGHVMMYHGFDLVRAAVGFDVRGLSTVAIGPLIGADLNMYLWERPDGRVNSQIADPRLNTYVYAGLQGRFDFGGVSDKEPPLLAKK